MKDVFVGTTFVMVVSLILASYAGNRIISPDQSAPIIPTQILEHYQRC